MTVEDGRLDCKNKPYGKKEVVLSTDEGMLSINGSARGEASYKDGVDYLLPGKIPADLYPLIVSGLKLCN